MNDPELKAGALTNGASAKDKSLPSAHSVQPDDLHDLFASTHVGTDDEDPLAALRDDPNYAALIRDLEYIATQARLLFEPATEVPSDEVWNKIKNKLETENPDA